jgi:hypothetical protein
LRIGLARVVEHLIGQAVFDDAPALHHHHPVRQQPRDGEVVRDDDDRQPEFGDEPANEIKQACLHRYVEARCRLIHEHKARMGDEIAGDLQTLAHAAGKSLRAVVDTTGIDLDAGEPVFGRIADLAVMASADGHQALTDIAARRDRHTQALRRVLTDEAPVGAHQKTALGLAQ